MKKFTHLFTVLLVVVFLAISLTACGLFGDDAPKVKTTKITVYVDGMPNEFTVTYNSTAEIGALAKSGCYMVGIEDDAGHKYFDEGGRSLQAWNEANPDTFYAKFEPLDSLAYSYRTMATNTVAIGTQEDHMTYSILYSYDSSKEKQFLSALKGNPECNVTITYSFDAKKQQNVWKPNLYVKVFANDDETLQSLTINEQPVDFKRYTYSVTVPARRLVNGLKISFTNNDFALCAKYIKNVDCKLEIFGE